MTEADNCELYAIAGRDMKKAESFKDKFGFKVAYEGYDKLLADEAVQAVYIPLPNNLNQGIYSRWKNRLPDLWDRKN